MADINELISAEELDNLPEDDDRAFVAAELICRRNVLRVVQQDDSERGDWADEMRLQYMTTVAALADQFNIPDLIFPADAHNSTYRAYADFARVTQAAVARIVARNRKSRNSTSVQLSATGRARIEQEISNLRRAIGKSNLPDARKNALHSKLDELAAELRNSRRVNFARAMAILVNVAAGVGYLGGAISGVAEVPAALANVLHWIGEDKAAEEAEIARLGGPPAPKAIPGPATRTLRPNSLPPPVGPWTRRAASQPSWNVPKTSELDDEIPF